MTKPLRYRDRAPPMPRAAWRWLLGQPQRFVPEGLQSGRSFHIQIGQWQYLLVKLPPGQTWEQYLAAIWRAHKIEIQAWHKRRWPRRHVPRTPEEMEASYERRHGHPTAMREG
jgi:hypothetical protein